MFCVASSGFWTLSREKRKFEKNLEKEIQNLWENRKFERVLREKRNFERNLRENKKCERKRKFCEKTPSNKINFEKRETLRENLNFERIFLNLFRENFSIRQSHPTNINHTRFFFEWMACDSPFSNRKTSDFYLIMSKLYVILLD